MSCEKCLKEIPENIGYCPTCKIKENTNTELPTMKNDAPVVENPLPEAPVILPTPVAQEAAPTMQASTVNTNPQVVVAQQASVRANPTNKFWFSGYMRVLGVILIILMLFQLFLLSTVASAASGVQPLALLLTALPGLLGAISSFGLAEVFQMVYDIRNKL